MRRVVTMVALLIINFVLQSSLFQNIEINDVKPNTALIIIISYAILRGDVEGAILGFCAGFLQDVFFGKIIGLHTLLFTLIGYFSGKPFKDFYPENYMIPIFLTTVFSFLYEIIFFFLNYFILVKPDFKFYFSKTIFPGSLYNIFVCVFVYIIVYFINKNIEDYEKIRKNIFNNSSSK